MTRKELLVMWIEGRYALGWRGYFAEMLLTPVINEILVKENKL